MTHTATGINSGLSVRRSTRLAARHDKYASHVGRIVHFCETHPAHFLRHLLVHRPHKPSHTLQIISSEEGHWGTAIVCEDACSWAVARPLSHPSAEAITTIDLGLHPAGQQINLS